MRGLGIGDWGLGIGDCGWAHPPTPNPQSPIPNPQSPFYNIIIFLTRIILKYFIIFILKNN